MQVKKIIKLIQRNAIKRKCFQRWETFVAFKIFGKGSFDGLWKQQSLGKHRYKESGNKSEIFIILQLDCYDHFWAFGKLDFKVNELAKSLLETVLMIEEINSQLNFKQNKWN